LLSSLSLNPSLPKSAGVNSPRNWSAGRVGNVGVVGGQRRHRRQTDIDARAVVLELEGIADVARALSVSPSPSVTVAVSVIRLAAASVAGELDSS